MEENNDNNNANNGSKKMNFKGLGDWLLEDFGTSNVTDMMNIFFFTIVQN